MKDNATTYRGVSISSGRVGTSGQYEGRAYISEEVHRTHRYEGPGAKDRALEEAKRMVDRLLPKS